MEKIGTKFSTIHVTNIMVTSLTTNDILRSNPTSSCAHSTCIVVVYIIKLPRVSSFGRIKIHTHSCE